MEKENSKVHNILNFLSMDEINVLANSAEFEDVEGVSREFRLYPTDYSVENEDLTSAFALISLSQWNEERFRAENFHQLQLELQSLLHTENLLEHPTVNKERDVTGSSSTDFLFTNREKLSRHNISKTEELIEVFQRNQNQKANAVLSNSKNLINKKAG